MMLMTRLFFSPFVNRMQHNHLHVRPSRSVCLYNPAHHTAQVQPPGPQPIDENMPGPSRPKRAGRDYADEDQNANSPLVL